MGDEPSCQLWTWGDNGVPMQYFIDCRKCTLWLGMVTMAGSGGGYECVGAEHISETSVPSIQFCCEPKSSLKVHVY
jgi:hypothetical protein